MVSRDALHLVCIGVNPIPPLSILKLARMKAIKPGRGLQLGSLAWIVNASRLPAITFRSFKEFQGNRLAPQ